MARRRARRHARRRRGRADPHDPRGAGARRAGRLVQRRAPLRGIWVLALAAVGAGGYGVWHLLYGGIG